MKEDDRICGCFNVTVKDIKDAKLKGCMSVDDVRRETKFGEACGRCKSKAELTVLKVLLNRLYIK
ncbi:MULTISPECIES: (2Fe-2S)-binding protein [Clostridia]|uniref:(2Fe-2S)-binding protein n=1 Tax=Clostridium sp. CCUG 7971 TaxID=2811414 RepID=UPI001ABB6FC8|nr:(2Fe-2S)-binding protein [Clostridium sp. CCUG 7971]MBO3443345.1 (2Fe-2S)-binding protein [Clostridium sp. CCUG 7971]